MPAQLVASTDRWTTSPCPTTTTAPSRRRSAGLRAAAITGALLLSGLSVTASASTSSAAEPRPVWGDKTELISIGADGDVADRSSYCCPSVSADGRYVAFESDATNLVPDDTNDAQDVFVRDRVTGETIRVSVATDGTQADGPSFTPSLSADGRVVAFGSDATNLVLDDTNGTTDVYLYDIAGRWISRVSLTSDGSEPDGASYFPSVSGDGELIAYMSDATNTVPGDGNGAGDVFVRDRAGTLTERISVSSDEAAGNGSSALPRISETGQYVAFASDATNLVTGDSNAQGDVFLRDRLAGTTERVSIGAAGAEGTGGKGRAGTPAAVSPDGQRVVFTSFQSNLVANDTNHTSDAFVRDRRLGTTTRVSVDRHGEQLGRESLAVSASADTQAVVFYTHSNRVVKGDRNGAGDIFVRDLASGKTRLVSVGLDGSANGVVGGGQISADGEHIAYWSSATNLAPEDDNGLADIFVRE